MDALTLGAIVVGVLVLIVAMVMLRRSWGSSLDHAPVVYDSAQTTAELADGDLTDIHELLARGNKIEAIKRVRERTGLGLKEAKDFVEALPRGYDAPLPVAHDAGISPVALDDTFLQEVRELLAGGNKIEAIKRVRERTGLGLKEAKDFVEALPGNKPSAFPQVHAPLVGDLSEVQALALGGNKIAAIKLYRELTGAGLKEAKDYVDRL